MSRRLDIPRRIGAHSRALKFRDWGKVAATFCDLQTGRAIRIAAKESSKQAAQELYPDLPREQAQQKAYAQLPDEVLFSKQWVKVEVPPEDLPGFKGPRVVCAECGEGINFKREVLRGRFVAAARDGERHLRHAYRRRLIERDRCGRGSCTSMRLVARTRQSV